MNCLKSLYLDFDGDNNDLTEKKIVLPFLNELAEVI